MVENVAADYIALRDWDYRQAVVYPAAARRALWARDEQLRRPVAEDPERNVPARHRSRLLRRLGGALRLGTLKPTLPSAGR